MSGVNSSPWFLFKILFLHNVYGIKGEPFYAILKKKFRTTYNLHKSDDEDFDAPITAGISMTTFYCS